MEYPAAYQNRSLSFCNTARKTATQWNIPANVVNAPSRAETPLNDFAWALVVLTSFPRAMLIMAGAFGLCRAGLISNALFAAEVAAVVLVLLGGTTWLSGGFWHRTAVVQQMIATVLKLVDSIEFNVAEWANPRLIRTDSDQLREGEQGASHSKIR
jgi:hypothetical protein